MPLLRTTPLAKLLLHIETTWPICPILYYSAHFSVLPTICTPHSFCVPHPYRIPIGCHLRPQEFKQSTSSHGSQFSIISIRPSFPYLEHLITLLLPTFTLNFLLSHSLTTTYYYTENVYGFVLSCSITILKQVCRSVPTIAEFPI